MKYRVIGFLLFISQMPFILGVQFSLITPILIGALISLILILTRVDTIIGNKSSNFRYSLIALTLVSVLISWFFDYKGCSVGALLEGCQQILNTWVGITFMSLFGLMFYIFILDIEIDNPKE